MILKKMLTPAGQSQVAVSLNQEWKLLDSSVDLLQFLDAGAGLDGNPLDEFDQTAYQGIIPFMPTAYRDFMLFEKHVIDASRGFVRKYLPGLFPIVNMYEKIWGKPFPKLKPKARYYQHPIYYLGNHLNFFTHEDSLTIPSYTQELDYELEIAAIITRPLKNADPDEVEKAIGGFVILNDFSARDVQMSEMSSGFGPMKAKNFGSAISHEVAPARLLLPKLDSLAVAVWINDKLITQRTTQGMYYSLPEAIAYASWEEQLHPGELFGSGTIPGCSGIENGVMLQKGDTITLEVESIGKLTNFII